MDLATVCACVLEFKVSNDGSVIMIQNKSSEPGPDPPNYLEKQWALHLPVVFDAAPLGKKIGDVHKDTVSSYNIVRETLCDAFRCIYWLFHEVVLFCRMTQSKFNSGPGTQETI